MSVWTEDSVIFTLFTLLLKFSEFQLSHSFCQKQPVARTRQSGIALARWSANALPFTWHPLMSSSRSWRSFWIDFRALSVISVPHRSNWPTLVQGSWLRPTSVKSIYDASRLRRFGNLTRCFITLSAWRPVHDRKERVWMCKKLQRPHSSKWLNDSPLQQAKHTDCKDGRDEREQRRLSCSFTSHPPKSNSEREHRCVALANDLLVQWQHWEWRFSRVNSLKLSIRGDTSKSSLSIPKRDVSRSRDCRLVSEWREEIFLMWHCLTVSVVRECTADMNFILPSVMAERCSSRRFERVVLSMGKAESPSSVTNFVCWTCSVEREEHQLTCLRTSSVAALCEKCSVLRLLHRRSEIENEFGGGGRTSFVMQWESSSSWTLTIALHWVGSSSNLSSWRRASHKKLLCSLFTECKTRTVWRESWGRI